MKKRERGPRRQVKPKPVAELTIGDLLDYPVWEYVGTDTPDETYVHPVRSLPVRSLDNRLVVTALRLANGAELLGLVGNVSPHQPRKHAHFLTVSVCTPTGWFFLARYFDSDWASRGPTALAKALGLRVGQVFPVRWDLSAVWAGPAKQVRGEIAAKPTKRLSRRARIDLVFDGG